MKSYNKKNGFYYVTQYNGYIIKIYNFFTKNIKKKFFFILWLYFFKIKKKKKNFFII